MKLLKGLLLAALLIASPAVSQTIIPATGSSLATPITPANGGTGVANTGNLTWTGALTFTDTTGQTFALPAASDTLAGLGTAQTFSKANVFSSAGAASTPGLSITGVPFSGTGTTSTPQFYVNSGASAPTTWSTSGTLMGGNAPSGFTGNLMDLRVNGGATLFTVASTGGINTAGVIQAGGTISAGATGLIGWNGRSVLSSPVAATTQFGNADAAAPVAQTISVQSVVAGTSNTAGVTTTLKGSLSTGSGTSGDVCIQTGGTGAGATVQNTAVTGLCVKGATQLVTLPAIASDATHTDSTVCQDTTTHGLYAGSGTLGVCLGTSSARYKRDIKPLPVGLADLMAIKPVQYFYRSGHGDNGARLQYGVTAENMAKAIPALASNDAEGRPNTADLVGLIPVLVNAIQEQQHEINSLRSEIRRTKGSR